MHRALARRSLSLLLVTGLALTAASGCRGFLDSDAEDETGSGDGDGDGDGDGVELIDNGGFEEWAAGSASGWYATPDVGHVFEQQQDECHGGTSCLRIDLGWDGSDDEYDQIQQTVGPLPAGAELLGAVWIREGGAVASIPVGMVLNLEYAEPDGNGDTYVTRPIKEIAAGPTWSEAAGAIVIEQEVLSAEVVLTAGNGAFEYDDATLVWTNPD